MERHVVGTIAVVVGALLVVFRRPFASFSIREQNRFWHFRMGARSERASRAVALVVGVGLIMVGVLMLVGVRGWPTS